MSKTFSRLGALAAGVGALIALAPAGAARPPRHIRHRPATVTSGPLAVVAQFERAYAASDKRTMLFKLMAPTQDANAIEKRYQWFRGYGPKDMPGTRHPPILFESSKGSFVPSSYVISSSGPAGPDEWSTVVREQGTYQDEDGRYRVNRLRHFKLTRTGGKWYVADYYLQENPEDYGFWVDDIVDKLTPIGR